MKILSVHFVFLLISFMTFSQTLTDYVNPFIGTDAHGHTYPGAVYPFGLVQLSPDTRKEGWDGCSGYHYSDSVVFGFSHTHLSGTGVSDYADVLIKPFSLERVSSQQNFNTEFPFSSKFSHQYENASPGYYSVFLDRDNILVELSATQRCGIHRYSFMNEEPPSIFIDLQYRDEVLDSYIHITKNNELIGYRKSKAWAQDQRIYFVIQFSAPIRKFIISKDNIHTDSDSETGSNIKVLLSFSPEHKQIVTKIGISGVDIEGARNNLNQEINDFDFDRIKKNAQIAWENELSKINITEEDTDKKTVFYTSLYHCMIVPNIFSDVDGRYMGRDFNIHKAEGFDYYTVFSLWDTYRAYHPLMTIIDRKRTSDFINTFIRQYEQGGLLPVWEFTSNETWCMIGYHAVPVIADAILKNIEGFDKEKAFQSIIESAQQDHHGLRYYKKYGFIPADYESESISKTLEYAFDDWCIANTARILTKNELYKEYLQRAQYYRNIFDPVTGFFRPKLNGNMLTPFDPREVNFHFTEANAWQYSMYIPQDVNGFIHLLGGDQELINKLDQLFSMTSQTTGRQQSDITGLIGQYAQGNEPSHHMAYLYAYCGQHYKTQEMANRIVNTFYTNSPDGLCGNEDCGQMSAWYVLSALGMYPVNPADGIFVFGSPQFKHAEINLENGKKFSISTSNRSQNNVYIQNVTLNEIQYEKTFIHYNEIMNGGHLHFVMGDTPNKNYGFSQNLRPESLIDEHLIVSVPYFKTDGRTFHNSTTVTLHAVSDYHQIYYSTDGSEPGIDSQQYNSPLLITESTKIKAVSYDPKKGFSKTAECEIHKVPEVRSIVIQSKYNPQYTAGGDKGIIDYLRGPVDFRTGYWQGYQNTDFEAIVHLGKKQEISTIAMGCLQDARSWIWMPKYVDVCISSNGKKWKYMGRIEHQVSEKDFTPQILDFKLTFKPVKTKYVKIFAKNFGTIPEWHPGKGGEGFIFTDEITIE